MERHYLADPEAACGKAAWQAIHDVGQALQLDFAESISARLSGWRTLYFRNQCRDAIQFRPRSHAYTRPHLNGVASVCQDDGKPYRSPGRPTI